MKLPNFFLVGAMKSGTTSLYQYLNAHPQVYMSPMKEPNFFCKDFTAESADRRKKITTWNEYVRLFDGVGDQPAIGEASVVYLCSKRAADEIHQALPNSRILILLRDPAERAYSQYLNEWKWKYDHGSFRKSLEHNRAPSEPLAWVSPQPHIELGRYHDQVKRYLDAFGADRVRIYLFDDLKRDRRSLILNVYDFLEIDSNFESDSFKLRFNTSAKPRFIFFDQMLVEPLSMRLFSPATRAKIRKRLRSVYYKGEPSPMLPEDRQYLITIFREDILRLQELIGRDLSSWLR